MECIEVIGLVLFVLLLLYLRIRKHYSYWQNLNIPCEDPHWIFGNLWDVTTKRTFYDVWQTYYTRFRNAPGPFVGFYWFWKRAVYIMDPGLIKQILIKDFNNFTDRGLFCNEVDDPLSGHLFNLSGTKWKNLRSKMSPTFTSGKMKVMFPTVVQVSHVLDKKTAATIEKSSMMDVRSLVSRYTTDVIGTCAFGIQCHGLEDPEEPFHIMSKRALLENHLGAFGVAFRMSFPELAARLHMRDTVKEIENFFMSTVRETVKYREENNIVRKDFMNLLLELKNNMIMKSETDENVFTNLSFNEIAAQAFVFLVAGSETSSTNMTFVLYELARHPEIQQKAREEILRVVGSQEMAYEHMFELKYLHQVVDETLRLHTPIPILNRVALTDYVVPGYSSYIIRKGMQIVIPSVCLHHDAQYYPDPKKFNPDNFSPEKVALRDSVLFMPFGDGPRNCIGMRFAKMQVIVGLSSLLGKYKFSMCEETPKVMTYDKENFVMSPEKDIILKVEKIWSQEEERKV